MSSDDKSPEGRTPSLRERMRPVEFLAIAAVLALFVGVVVLLATREPVLALIFFGVAFIATLVVLALFVLGFKPDEAEREELGGHDPGHPELPDAGGHDGGPGNGGTPGGPRNPHD